LFDVTMSFDEDIWISVGKYWNQT